MNVRTHWRCEDGATAVTYPAALALTMLVFVVCANVIAVSYTRAVVRGALDEGVRAAVVLGGTDADCHARADAVLATLGRLRHGVTHACAADDQRVTATASVTVTGWLPIVPTADFTLDAVAARPQPEPTP